MNQQEKIQVFGQLGRLFENLSQELVWNKELSGVTEIEFEQLVQVIRKEHQLNPWFTLNSIQQALGALSQLLQVDNMTSFASKYPETKKAKRVALIMAGNIPLVGLHDVLCTVLSGHIAVCKLSSQDSRLFPAFYNCLKLWNPEIANCIEIVVGPIRSMDAVIATGSTNSTLYFEQYFGQYPHIFRGNRTSIAVLDGTETEEELVALGNDVFAHFGLGCRNVSKLLIHDTVDLNKVFEGLVAHGDIVNHHKYANNYDYNRTIYLMNQIPFLDNNFCLLKEDDGLHSPLSVVFTQRYSAKDEVTDFISKHQDKIQAVVGHDYIPFGKAQQPAIDDFADGIDTMKWLVEI